MAQLPGKPNILIFLNDQQNRQPWFPAGWDEANLPFQSSLAKNGLTFSNAFCAANMCSPARVSLFTGIYTSASGTYETLTSANYQSPYESELRPDLPNLATVLKAAGYDVVYKGKWHMSKGYFNLSDGASYVSDNISRYGFDEWDGEPPLGLRGIGSFGGGYADNDGLTKTRAIKWLTKRLSDKSNKKPWALVVSLINPHDVPISYPSSGPTPKWIAGGYNASWLEPTSPPIALPPSFTEIPGQLVVPSANDTDNAWQIIQTKNTSVKPDSETWYLLGSNLGLGLIDTPELATNFVNFYARATILADSIFQEVWETFKALGGEEVVNNTIVFRTADHGEMMMAHGAQRQKPYLPYHESLQVPFIFSNPVLWPEAKTTTSLASHLDVIPTFCDIVGVNCTQYGFMGKSLLPIFKDETAKVNDRVFYNFEDIWATFDYQNPPLLNQATGSNVIKNISNGVLPSPNRLWVMIDENHTVSINHQLNERSIEDPHDQSACYDNTPEGGDYNAEFGLPLQLINLSPWAVKTRAKYGLEPVGQQAQLQICKDKVDYLRKVQSDVFVFLPPWSIVPPENVTGRFFKNETMCPDMCLEFTFITRQGQVYNVEVNTTNGPLEVSNITNGNTAQYHFDVNIPGSNGPFYGIANVPVDSTGFKVVVNTAYSGMAIPIPPVKYMNFTGIALPGNGSTAVSKIPELAISGTPITGIPPYAAGAGAPAPSSSAALMNNNNNSWSVVVALLSTILAGVAV